MSSDAIPWEQPSVNLVDTYILLHVHTGITYYIFIFVWQHSCCVWCVTINGCQSMNFTGEFLIPSVIARDWLTVLQASPAWNAGLLGTTTPLLEAHFLWNCLILRSSKSLSYYSDILFTKNYLQYKCSRPVFIYALHFLFFYNISW